MSVIGGRGGRTDDWASEHARARARSAEQLDGPLEADEAAWLDGHLASCPECAAVAADYAAQRLELRALREPTPVPPRDSPVHGKNRTIFWRRMWSSATRWAIW